MEPSRAWETRVIWWAATTAAKAIPNPYRIKAKAYAEQMSSDERLFWKEVRQVFGAVHYDGDDERSGEKVLEEERTKDIGLRQVLPTLRLRD